MSDLYVLKVNVPHIGQCEGQGKIEVTCRKPHCEFIGR